MAIVFDTAAGFNYSTGSQTKSFTVGSGANRILFVGVLALNNSAGEALSGVTYNGVAMTQVRKVQSSGDFAWTYLYQLVNPASGAHNIVATNTNPSNCTMGVAAASYAGALQTSPIDNSAATIGGNSGISVSPTIAGGGEWVVGYGAALSGSFQSRTGWNGTAGDGNNVQQMGDSAGIAPPSSYNIGIGSGNSPSTVMLIAASFFPVPSPSSGFFAVMK